MDDKLNGIKFYISIVLICFSIQFIMVHSTLKSMGEKADIRAEQNIDKYKDIQKSLSDTNKLLKDIIEKAEQKYGVNLQ